MKKIVLAVSALVVLNSCTKDIMDTFSTDKIKITKDIKFNNAMGLYTIDGIKPDYIVFNRPSYLNKSDLTKTLILGDDGTVIANGVDSPYIFKSSSLKLKMGVDYPNSFFGVTRKILKDYTIGCFSEANEGTSLKLERGKTLFYVFNKSNNNDFLDFQTLISEGVIAPIDYNDDILAIHFVYNMTMKGVKQDDNVVFHYSQPRGTDGTEKQVPIYGDKTYLPVIYSYKLNNEDHILSDRIRINYDFKFKDASMKSLNEGFKELYNGPSLFYEIHKSKVNSYK